MTLVSVCFQNYDVEKTTAAYYRDNQESCFPIKREISYEDIDGVIQSHTSKRGHEFYQTLVKQFDAKQVIPCMEEMEINSTKGNRTYIGTCIVLDMEQSVYDEYLDGSYPKAANELVISETIANDLGLKNPIYRTNRNT